MPARQYACRAVCRLRSPGTFRMNQKRSQGDKPPLATSAATPGSPSALPTLQSNALRKIFERPTFTPAEVARLGYRRLHQADGIGQKGLNIIIAWLRQYGYQLKPLGPPAGKPAKKLGKNLESALRILRSNGYVVYRRHNDVAGEQELPAKTS